MFTISALATSTTFAASSPAPSGSKGVSAALGPACGLTTATNLITTPFLVCVQAPRASCAVQGLLCLGVRGKASVPGGEPLSAEGCNANQDVYEFTYCGSRPRTGCTATGRGPRAQCRAERTERKNKFLAVPAPDPQKLDQTQSGLGVWHWMQKLVRRFAPLRVQEYEQGGMVGRQPQSRQPAHAAREPSRSRERRGLAAHVAHPIVLRVAHRAPLLASLIPSVHLSPVSVLLHLEFPPVAYHSAAASGKLLPGPVCPTLGLTVSTTLVAPVSRLCAAACRCGRLRLAAPPNVSAS